MNETTKEVSTTVEAKCFYDISVVERESKGNDSPFLRSRLYFTKPMETEITQQKLCKAAIEKYE